MVNKNGRVFLQYVTIAKGLAILLVVSGHFFDQTLSAGVYQELRSVNTWFRTMIYSLHMPWFFALSGLLAGLPGADYNVPGHRGAPLIGRARRLLLPYLAVSLIQIPMQAVGRDGASWFELPQALLSVFYNPSVQLWFVYSLFLMFAVMPLIEKLLGGRTPAVFLFLFICSYLSGYVPTEYFEIRTTLHNQVFFFVGLLLGRHYAAGQSWDGLRRYFWFMVCAWFALASLYFMMLGDGPTAWHIPVLMGLVKIVAGLAGTLAFMHIAQLLSRRSARWYTDALNYVGRYSYDIYLFHYIVMGTLNSLLLRKGLPYPAIIAVMVIPSILFPLIGGRFALDRWWQLSLVFRGVKPKRQT